MTKIRGFVSRAMPPQKSLVEDLYFKFMNHMYDNVVYYVLLSPETNRELEKTLRKIGINTKETWDKILADGGSVQDLAELDEWGFISGKLTQRSEITPEQIANKEVDWSKDVFKTFKEINQLELVKQAGIRQQYVDQSVSLNLAFPAQASPKWINQVHMEAWKQGIKTLYYMRTESVLRGDIAARATDPDCLSCDG